ncbi:MAG TPA: DUF5602 domain-containing protein [Armatimonadota bacterium]|jgi:hypothetical protein
MVNRTPALWLLLAGLLLFGINTRASACENCKLKKAGLYIGEATLLGNGSVRSWVEIDEARRPAAVGVTFTETALTGLPTEVPKTGGMPGYEYRLALPAQARVQGIDNIGLDWNPKGHEPQGVYDVPHFDVHFYTIPVAARDKISLVGADMKRCQKPAPAQFVPAGYIMAPKTEVPKMGVHWASLKAPEFNGQPFTDTYIWGTYDGQQAFFEPMVAMDFLKARPNVTRAIPQPRAVAKHGWYPTRYRIAHNPDRQEYTIALEGLTYR